MKKIVFYSIGVVWMITGLLSVGFVGAVDTGAPMLSSYIKAILFGCISFGCLVILQNMMWEV